MNVCAGPLTLRTVTLLVITTRLLVPAHSRSPVE
ncbi:MAG: hypothetical protein BWY59_00497 [Verrucomicrobia bacterium ADurb.Bin345]|nr:MAG: hypothetical protein BWY59_00497 [Verrucomicrobia bacterium ADurb.Bin345]